MTVKYNMGCGFNQLDGAINVDRSAECKPDEIWDLEKTPWPWETSSADEVYFSHSLEHLGQDPNVYLAIMQETYRICKPNAVVAITVPHPRHDHFLADPTHVRPITTLGLSLFSKKMNQQWIDAGASNSPLGIYLDVDFEITDARMVLDEPFKTMFADELMTQAEISTEISQKNNVVSQMEFKMVAVKE